MKNYSHKLIRKLGIKIITNNFTVKFIFKLVSICDRIDSIYSKKFFTILFFKQSSKK